MVADQQEHLRADDATIVPATGNVPGSSASKAVAIEARTMSPMMAAARIATHTKPRAVRRMMSRSGVAEKIRENATSSVTYSWLTVQTTPTRPMRPVIAAPWLTAIIDCSMISVSGGNASISAWCCGRPSRHRR